jgi:uncharacterized protein (TIGR01777 family)
MRIAIAGSSGFLGTHLVRLLRAENHDVVRLVRREPGSAGEVRWDPANRVLDPTVLSTVDAVVNLAGANVGRRWTEAYKRRIRASRIDTTATLAGAIAAAGNPPPVFLNSSGVDYYGDTGDQAIDETSPPGQGFLADLCREWEAATGPAEDAGVRVVRLRTGPPLHAGAGFLKPLLIQFRLFAGGRLGNGRHYVPWISLADWLGAARFLLGNAAVSGAVNMTGPNAVTNAEFTRALAEVLHRPALLPLPGFALRLVLGEFSTVALASHRVLPAVLLHAGYEFRHTDVRSALRAALDRRQAA